LYSVGSLYPKRMLGAGREDKTWKTQEEKGLCTHCKFKAQNKMFREKRVR